MSDDTDSTPAPSPFAAFLAKLQAKAAAKETAKANTTKRESLRADLRLGEARKRAKLAHLTTLGSLEYLASDRAPEHYQAIRRWLEDRIANPVAALHSTDEKLRLSASDLAALVVTVSAGSDRDVARMALALGSTPGGESLKVLASRLNDEDDK